MIIKPYVKIMCSMTLLSGIMGCTSLTSSQSQLNDTPSTKQMVQLSCGGVDYCQFERVDNVQLLNLNNDWITVQALRSGMIKIKDSKLTKGRLKFDLTVPAQLHEVSVKFYPVSEYRAEKLTLIHNFQAGYKYSLTMYRQRAKPASLFEVSAPDPLCVDLKQSEITVRRFCRTHDALLGFGEFIEQKIQKG